VGCGSLNRAMRGHHPGRLARRAGDPVNLLSTIEIGDRALILAIAARSRPRFADLPGRPIRRSQDLRGPEHAAGRSAHSGPPLQPPRPGTCARLDSAAPRGGSHHHISGIGRAGGTAADAARRSPNSVSSFRIFRTLIAAGMVAKSPHARPDAILARITSAIFHEHADLHRFNDTV
jgi:hypothetical protein